MAKSKRLPKFATLLCARDASDIVLRVKLLFIGSEAEVTLTDGTFSWDSEDPDKATLKK